MQLNACVTIAIFEMKEIHHDAHLIWATLKDKYDEAKYDVQI
jgi:hypothetical protein